MIVCARVSPIEIASILGKASGAKVKCKYAQTDRQTDRQTHRHTDIRQTDTHTHAHRSRDAKVEEGDNCDSEPS